MLFAAAKRELAANGTAESQYRDGARPVRTDLRPAEPISGTIPTHPGSIFAPTAISELVNIRKR